MKSDWIVDTQFGMGGMSPTSTKRIDALPETGSVTPLRYVDAKVDGAATRRHGVRPGHGRADRRPRRAVAVDLTTSVPHDVAVQADEAKKHGPAASATR